MSVEAITVVLNHSRARGSEKLVLIGIANHHGDQGAWPSVETLTRYTNLSERRVQQTLVKLAELGELVIEKGGGAGVGKYKTNKYWITIKCPANCGGFPNHSQPKPASADSPKAKPIALQSEARFGLEVKPSADKPLREPSKETNKHFEIFWGEYPKKVDKGLAKRSYLNALRKASASELLEGAKKYAAQVADTERRFIKNPSTWLNAEAWLNEAPTPKAAPSIWNREE
jgi:hypothetical protein